MKRSFADILQGLDDERAQKLARKLPEWAAAGAEIPSALALEQCSSAATAAYKATLYGGISPEPPAALESLSDFRFAKVPEPGRSADADFASLEAIPGNVPASAAQAATASENRSHPRLRKREGPASEGSGRGPAQQDVFGGSSPLREAEAKGTVLDLTGGLGVDSWALAKVAERVVYFERDAELAEAAKRNFARLGVENIEVRCETVTPKTELPEADLIYADPARRNAAGRKVFLLEDCTPDILTLLPMLLEKAPAVLLKLSPMADLSMLAGRLGPSLREIHVVELDGEVKELLCLLQRCPASAEPEIIVTRLGGEPFRFSPQEERDASAVYAPGVNPGDILLEPCPALLKAGAFRLPCSRWGLQKIAPSTHLYLLPAVPGTKVPSSVPGESFSTSPGTKKVSSVPGNDFFKPRRIREILPFGAAFKDLRKRYPRADITARNLPMGSEAIRKKTGVCPGGDTHIFACRLADGSAVLIVCETFNHK